MGGYGSGGHNRKCITVESCARIDAGMLRKAGAFRGTGAWTWHWSKFGSCVCDTSVISINDPSRIIITIHRDGIYNSQFVGVSTTNCHYGKSRFWLHCPVCNKRVFRLYLPIDAVYKDEPVMTFACRSCYACTYNQRSMRSLDRYQSQAMQIQQHLGDTSTFWDTPPHRPKGMWHRTYERFYDKWWAAVDKAQGLFEKEFDRLSKRNVN